MAWFNGLAALNPGAAQVLVDTGPLSAASYDVTISIQVSVQTTVLVELRDITDTATLKSIELRLAGARFQEKFEGVNLANGQRLRVSTVGAFTGTIETDMFVVIRNDTVRSPV